MVIGSDDSLRLRIAAAKRAAHHGVVLDRETLSAWVRLEVAREARMERHVGRIMSTALPYLDGWTPRLQAAAARLRGLGAGQ